MMDLHHKRPVWHGQGMHREQVEASDAHLKNAILDVKAVSNVDIGPAEVDVAKVVVERMAAKKRFLQAV